MDRIESMTLLSEIKHYLTAGNPVWDVDEIAEALDMAIEALQNLPKPNNGLQGSDLISRSRAIEGIREYINEYKYNDIKWAAMKEAEMLIESLPSEDAVEVVRCGRCEWWKCNPNTEEYGVCKKVSYDGFEVVMNSDDFCSYGEDGEA